MGRKWNNIKYGKAAKDASRSKIYAKFGLEIFVAAKGEPDPEINRTLAAVIDKAKTYKVPRDIIDRAIEKAKGGKADSYEKIRYEGYGPNGSAIIVDCLTDNINRTVSEVRATFSKHGGSLGVNGSVTFMFEQAGLVGASDITEDQVLEALMEVACDVNDIEVEEDGVLVYTTIENFQLAQQAFKSIGVEEFTTCEISMLPITNMSLSGEALEKFERLVDTLDELDDVQNVYHNVE
jgi:YebC/PmpR family DNA-binding regulatory protein